MKREAITNEILSQMDKIHEVADNGLLSTEVLLRNAMQTHGMMRSPYREEEAKSRILGLLTHVAAIVRGISTSQFLDEVYAEREVQKTQWREDANHTLEDWFLILKSQLNLAFNYRLQEMNDIGRPGRHSMRGRLICFAAVAVAALEHQ